MISSNGAMRSAQRSASGGGVCAPVGAVQTIRAAATLPCQRASLMPGERNGSDLRQAPKGLAPLVEQVAGEGGHADRQKVPGSGGRISGRLHDQRRVSGIGVLEIDVSLAAQML